MSDELRLAAVRHAIASQRYSNGLARKIVKLLNEADEELVEKLNARLLKIEKAHGLDAGPATTKRITDMIATLRSLNDRVYKRLADELEADLTDLAAYEVEREAKSVSKLTAVKAVAPAPQVLKTLVTTGPIDGHLLKSWTDHMSSSRLARVEQAVRLGIVQGETIDQMVRRIRGTKAGKFKDGVLEVSRRSAEALVRTAVSTVQNTARHEVYKANPEIVSEVQWLATLDERTSPICQHRDGQRFDISKPHPTPPAHINCRCVMTAVIAGYEPSKRASKDGPVKNQTFGQWLKSQPPETVANVMGKQRADMLLKGKITFKEFFNDKGEYYTLDELKRRSS